VPSPARRDPPLVVTARTHRRTALIELHGELDIATVPAVAQVVEEVAPHAEGVRHLVLDLRGVTFMDVVALRELLRQNEKARDNRRNLAVVRGGVTDRLLRLTQVEPELVLVDDPADLVPPAAGAAKP
jgi:anti-anti-sigma factor